jgi:hypothetical protein
MPGHQILGNPAFLNYRFKNLLVLNIDRLRFKR